MGLFSRQRHGYSTTSSRRTSHHRFYRPRKDRDRVAGGYKAALTNPNTTKSGRDHAKAELHMMGRSAHVPFMTKVKRALGIRSTPRRKREASRRERERVRY